MENYDGWKIIDAVQDILRNAGTSISIGDCLFRATPQLYEMRQSANGFPVIVPVIEESEIQKAKNMINDAFKPQS